MDFCPPVNWLKRRFREGYQVRKQKENFTLCSGRTLQTHRVHAGRESKTHPLLLTASTYNTEISGFTPEPIDRELVPRAGSPFRVFGESPGHEGTARHGEEAARRGGCKARRLQIEELVTIGCCGMVSP